MADETTNNEVVEQPTEESRMQNALDFLGQQELDEVNKEEPEQQEPVEEPQKQPQEDRSDYYAKLVEKDKEIRQLKSQIKGNQVDYKDLAQKDPSRVLQELGIGIDQVIDLWANQEAPQAEDAPEPKSNEELHQLKQELEQIKQERQQQQLQQALNNELNKIYSKVNADGEDRWELVKTTNNYELVLETAAEAYKANPDNPPEYDEVLTAVENYLEEHYGQMYEQLSKVNKLQSKFSVKAEPPVKEEAAKEPTPASFTLSTSQSADTPAPRGLNEQERFQRALQVLENSGD